MGKCNTCGYLHPYPGYQTCRFYKEAREKAREARDKNSWKLYLDIATLEDLQTVEEAKSKAPKGTVGGIDIKPVVQPVSLDQIADLTRKMDWLTTQMQGLLPAQPQVAAPVSQGPPLKMAAVLSVVTTTGPIISGTGMSVYATSTPVSTVASTM